MGGVSKLAWEAFEKNMEAEVMNLTSRGVSTRNLFVHMTCMSVYNELLADTNWSLVALNFFSAYHVITEKLKGYISHF